MLHEIVKAYGGTLPDDVVTSFANTGKEREQTLEFVQECTECWGVNVHWLEYCRKPGPVVEWRGKRAVIACHGFREVTFKTASRRGEPFEQLIDVLADYRREAKDEGSILPNVTQRWCSAHMKARVMEHFMQSLGHESFTTVIGFRADEYGRVARLKDRETDYIDFVTPLQKAGVMERDVMAFWRSQPFDLKLKQYEGNCDLCFLKSRHKLESLIRDNPGMVDWWAEQERRTGASFARNVPSFTDYKTGRVPLRTVDDDDLGLDTPTCFCTD